MFKMATSFLHLLEPERAHEVAVTALKAGVHPRPSGRDDDNLAVDLWGLHFSNPLGIAAGFDKNAEVPDAILDLGFGFAEVGTVTPRPQEGNPRPRMFRLPQERAVINRLGFNNEGHAAVLERLKRRRRRGIIGVNIGANKDSDDKASDYVRGLEAFWDVASYFTVNVSSPNTPGLRGLQEREPLEDLLGRLSEKRKLCAATGEDKPILLKIAPDLDDAAVQDIAEVCLAGDVDGAIVSNTTITRPGVQGRVAEEQGGLSGAPLFELSTRILAKFSDATGAKLPLIGVGGVSSGADAYAKICAGASLVQLYTGLVYTGPGLAQEIKRDLAAALVRDGHGSLADAVGSRVADYSA